MCDFNCSECKTPCSLGKISPKLNEHLTQTENNKKERDQKMALGSCSTGNDEKLGRADERIDFVKILSWICMACIPIGLVLFSVIVICFQNQIAELKMDVRDNKNAIGNMKESMVEIKFMAIDAQRGYNNARKTLQRARGK